MSEDGGRERMIVCKRWKYIVKEPKRETEERRKIRI